MSVNIFDANFYRAANPDLAKLNNTQAKSHFQTFGLNEGREFSPFVDLNFYRSSNSDLANFNNQQTYDHLRNHGIAEGRRFSPFVDLNFYQDAYSDLTNFNNEQVFKHLRDYGINEERRFSPFVDLNFYRAANSDLASFSNKQALQHLKIHGLNEGRDFSLPFDIDYYKSRNSDLLAAGLNNSQLLQHFELNGLNEGRASSPNFNISYYLSHNPDLATAGFNFKQAYDHYVLYGNSEGRFGVAPATQQWIQQLATANVEYSNDVAVDSAGNIYTTGNTYGSLAGTNAGSSDAWVAKYDTGGALLWVQQFGTVGSDSATALGVDGAGNIYITGVTDGSFASANAGDNDPWLAKYDTSGNRQWIQQFGTSTRDVATDIAVDTVGNVYLTGHTNGSLGAANAGELDAWLTKYDTSGNQQWIQQFGTSYNDSYRAVAVDATGNIYITGDSSGYLEDPVEGEAYNLYNNAWLAKYNSSGNRIWIKESNSREYYDVAVDGVGNVYITGENERHILMSKYDSSGNRLWIQQSSGDSYREYGFKLAIDGADSLYSLVSLDSSRGFSSTTLVVKYDASSGYRLGTQYSGNFDGLRLSSYRSIKSLAVDNAGNFYLTGNSLNFPGETSDDAWVAKFSQPLDVG